MERRPEVREPDFARGETLQGEKPFKGCQKGRNLGSFVNISLLTNVSRDTSFHHSRKRFEHPSDAVELCLHELILAWFEFSKAIRPASDLSTRITKIYKMVVRIVTTTRERKGIDPYSEAESKRIGYTRGQASHTFHPLRDS